VYNTSILASYYLTALLVCTYFSSCITSLYRYTGIQVFVFNNILKYLGIKHDQIVITSNLINILKFNLLRSLHSA